MNTVDEYLKWNVEKERKLRFIVGEGGAADIVVKRVDKSLRGVYEQLRFLRCPHLSKVCAIEEKEDYLEVAEQYIDGRSLQYVLDERGAQDDAFVQRLARQMAETLKLLHGLRPPVIHRDMKPQNIMQHGDDFILIDFDAARSFDKNARRDTVAIGTQGYAAPEQYGFAQTDARSDIFSLGVTLYEMRMGEPYQKGALCDGALRKVIAKCTQFVADERYQSADELLIAIKKASRESGKRRAILKFGLAATMVCAALAFVWGRAESKKAPGQDVCTCKLVSDAKSGDEGAIFTPVDVGIDEARVGVSQICVRLPVDASGCTASEHKKQKVTYRLSEAAAALGATMDEYDIVTVGKPGIYTVFYTAELNGQICKGNFKFHAHDEITGETELNSHAQGCTCKLIEPVDVRDSSAVFRPNAQIIVGDQPVSAEVYVHYSVDSSGCTAKVHSNQVVTYELGDESIGMGATLDGDVITVDTPGLYTVYYAIEFNGEVYRGGFGFGIDG